MSIHGDDYAIVWGEARDEWLNERQRIRREEENALKQDAREPWLRGRPIPLSAEDRRSIDETFAEFFDRRAA